MNRLPYVEHAVIYGAGKPFLVALFSLNLNQLRERTKQKKLDIGIETKDIPKKWYELIKNDVLREVSELQGYLQPAGLLITLEPFTIESCELTANLKLRRKIIAEKYQEDIVSLYEEILNKHQIHSSGPGRTKEFVIHCL